MTVRIPIEGDPSGAIRAVDEFRTALRAAAGEGRALSEIDLSKLGSADLAKDLERAAANLRDLSKMGRGQTATDARRIFGPEPGLDALFNINEAAAKHFPDPRDRARFVRNVSTYTLRGTSYDPANAEAAPDPDVPPPPPTPPGAPPPSKPFSFGGGGVRRHHEGHHGRPAGRRWVPPGADGAIVHRGRGRGRMQAGEAGNDATDQLLRRTGDLASTFDQLRAAAGAYHEDLLVSHIDFTRAAAAYAATTGVGPGAALHATRLPVGLAESYGQDPGGFIRGMGSASVLGLAPDRFAALVGEAVWHLQHYILPMMAKKHMQMNDLGAYATWHFGSAGADVMAAPDSASIGQYRGAPSSRGKPLPARHDGRGVEEAVWHPVPERIIRRPGQPVRSSGSDRGGSGRIRRRRRHRRRPGDRRGAR